MGRNTNHLRRKMRERMSFHMEAMRVWAKAAIFMGHGKLITAIDDENNQSY
jgi:hypothetical protein